MKQELAAILHQVKTFLNKECEDERIRNQVNVAIDMVNEMPDDWEVERWKKDSITLSWDKFPDKMGQ